MTDLVSRLIEAGIPNDIAAEFKRSMSWRLRELTERRDSVKYQIKELGSELDEIKERLQQLEAEIVMYEAITK